jgi:hypothetical protein
VKQGLHDKKASAKKAGLKKETIGKTAKKQASLFDGEDGE